MLKYRTEQDKRKFLLEVGKDDPVLFVKRRKSLVKKLVDFSKSQRSKAGWAKSRFKHLTGIRKFHRSVRGKRFHRQLARFMLTRLTRSDEKYSRRKATLAAISSLRTHMYIESQYYDSIEDSCEFQIMYEYAVPVLLRAESKIFACEDLNVEEEEILLRLIEHRELIRAARDISKCVAEELSEKLAWENISDCNEGMRDFMLAICSE